MELNPIELTAELLRRTRNFMESHGFLEVITNHVVGVGAFEATLDCVEVKSLHLSGQLHTSPELAMKCLLADFPRDIYQICRCFRDDPPGRVHFAEFTMLELYRPHRDYRDVLALTKHLIELLKGESLKWRMLSVNQAFEERLGFEVSGLDRRELAAKAVPLCRVTDVDTWEDIFFKLMLEYIEPGLDAAIPTVLYDYPPALCTLLKGNERGLVERFEIYWRGMEICNGGTELVDERALRDRYGCESRTRERSGKKPHNFPTDLAKKMAGMPPMAGVAIGLERLFSCVST